MSRTLSELGLTPLTPSQTVIQGIALDSRKVADGYLFAALPGSTVHGAAYIDQVIVQGAAAILTDRAGYDLAKEALMSSGVDVILAEDPRAAFSSVAALWYGRMPNTIVAVTGTNGKTSVSNFCRQIWCELDYEAINIGTTGVEGAWSYPLAHTTPDPLTLHHVLASARSEGITHAAMEASSHGLDQKRLDGVRLKAAGFTNFTQDHLDYHETFEAYFEAKAGLFNRVLPDDGWVVVNVDDPKGAELINRAKSRGQNTIKVGQSEGADLRLLRQAFSATGQTIRFEWLGKSYVKDLNLIGGFQAENILLACGLVIAAGAPPDHVFDTLPHLKTVRGRMELAAKRQNGASVFVDYAHTPDAIETAVDAFRPHVMGKLVAVIGAGGDRDKTKRPLMAQAALKVADYVIVTDDNPRSEDPSSIRAMVMDGAPKDAPILEVADRAEAILRAVDMLEPGDGLIITGKGHETGQIIGDDILPFDDVEQASVAVAALDGMM